MLLMFNTYIFVVSFYFSWQ